MRIFVALVVLTVLIGFYFLCWHFNRKQKLPEGMEKGLPSCGSCDQTSCGSHPNNRGDEDE